MTWNAKLLELAKVRAKELKLQRASPRFQKVVGKLLATGLLFSNETIKPYSGKIQLADALWAGEIEPRIYELLPALILKRPSLFKSLEKVPEDLDQVIKSIRKNQANVDFRGIPAKAYLAWIPKVVQSGKLPSLLKSFRFRHDDVALLEDIKSHGYS